jgi:hypothetical protein
LSWIGYCGIRSPSAWPDVSNLFNQFHDMRVWTVVNGVKRILSFLFFLSIDVHDHALPEQAGCWMLWLLRH